VEQVIRRVRRELKLQNAPVAKLLQGRVVSTGVPGDGKEKHTEDEQADKKHSMEEGQIGETDEDRSFEKLVKQLDGDSDGTKQKLDFEKKEH
jgi:hypothetical protein